MHVDVSYIKNTMVSYWDKSSLNKSSMLFIPKCDFSTCFFGHQFQVILEFVLVKVVTTHTYYLNTSTLFHIVFRGEQNSVIPSRVASWWKKIGTTLC
jgi:hypothetical protein